jgi:hypothetical protein
MDCLTTVIGTLYYGTRELNPILADLVSSNLPAFVFVRLTVTVSVGLIIVLAEKNTHEIAKQKLIVVQNCTSNIENCLFRHNIISRHSRRKQPLGHIQHSKVKIFIA